MQDILIIALVAVILAAAGVYVYKQKKTGAACIGCPHSKNCPSRKNGSCSCGE